MKDYKRYIFQILSKRLQEPRRFIQVLSGPRQVGKTTAIKQFLIESQLPAHYVSADEPGLQGQTWLTQQWEVARAMTQKDGRHSQQAIFIIDEIQKIANWSTIIKQHWDEDSMNNYPLHVVILGSAPLLIEQGLSESLAGRFETIHATHWSFQEMQQAFAWNLQQYIYFGGYPGAASLIDDVDRWSKYIKDSLIETTLSRDILLLVRINKPALLRRLFQLGCCYSAKILSYQKMLGQLQDAGNTTTLSHYLNLLDQAGMLTGIEKYAGQEVRKRSSSPKFQVYNTALLSAQNDIDFVTATQNPIYWGQLVESAVGAYLCNQAIGTQIKIYYWREHNQEVDFILTKGKKIVALEVKSQYSTTLSGMAAFEHAFKPQKILQIGGQGMPLETFFKLSIDEWFR
jgi:uncharacterized protein